MLLVKTIAKYCIDYILPSSCLTCTNYLQDEHSFCHECLHKIDFITQALCKICGRPFSLDLTDLVSSCTKCMIKKPSYDSARALMKYDNIIAKKIIHNFKYNDKTWLGKSLAKLLYRNYAAWINDCDIVIAVPMHKLKRLFRGYNQAHILAENIAKEIQRKLIVNCLIKTKWTKSQTTLTKTKRLSNLEGSFRVKNQHLIYGKNVLLVDDVITTGSTVNICSKILKNHGAKSVKVLAIAVA